MLRLQLILVDQGEVLVVVLMRLLVEQVIRHQQVRLKEILEEILLLQIL